MSYKDEFVDILEQRRKESDLVWVSRPLDLQPAHKLNKEHYSRKQMINAALSNPNVQGLIKVLSTIRGVSEFTLFGIAQSMLFEMASKSHKPTARWLGKDMFLSVKSWKISNNCLSLFI